MRVAITSFASNTGSSHNLLYNMEEINSKFDKYEQKLTPLWKDIMDCASKWVVL